MKQFEEKADDNKKIQLFSGYECPNYSNLDNFIQKCKEYDKQELDLIPEETKENIKSLAKEFCNWILHSNAKIDLFKAISIGEVNFMLTEAVNKNWLYRILNLMSNNDPDSLRFDWNDKLKPIMIFKWFRTYVREEILSKYHFSYVSMDINLIGLLGTTITISIHW